MNTKQPRSLSYNKYVCPLNINMIRATHLYRKIIVMMISKGAIVLCCVIRLHCTAPIPGNKWILTFV